MTAWATESGLTLGQVACEGRSNEITAIPELLRLLNLKGSIVTIDAMGCQTAIAAQKREQKGHNVLALKGNRSGLLEDMEELADQAIEADFAGQKYDMHVTDETGHGREEKRICCAIEVPPDHPQRLRWTALCTLVIMTCCRMVERKETWERRLYISSHRKSRAKALSQAIRRHWSIENSQHWCLDVTFGEDVRRQQNRQGAANLAAVRLLSLSLLRQQKTNKRGITNKRLSCALSPDYLLKVLANAQF